MSVPRMLRTPRRCDSSNLSTSTPVNSRPIINDEPVQSPIEQTSVNSRTAITPLQLNTLAYKDKLRQSSNNDSISRYLTRSQSKILNVSLGQNKSESDAISKRKSNTNHCVEDAESRNEVAKSNKARRKSSVSNVSAEAIIKNSNSLKTPLLKSRGAASERRRCRIFDKNEMHLNKSRKSRTDDKGNIKNDSIEENVIEKKKSLNEISQKSRIPKRTKSLNNIKKPSVEKKVLKEGNPNSLLSDNVAAGESCDSTSNRNSDNFCSSSSFKPSFIRRKLYSKSSDFTEDDSKQINNSFLEKKNVRSLYSLKTAEASNGKILSSEDNRKSTDNLRQYCLRKTNTKHFNQFFGENNNQIINDVIDGTTKENTRKFVSNILNDINTKTILTASNIPDKTKDISKNIHAVSTEVPPNQAEKETLTECVNVNSEEDSCFEIFSKKMTPKKSSNVVKAKSNRVSKPKLPTKVENTKKETVKKIKCVKVPVKVVNVPKKKKSIESVKNNSVELVKRRSGKSHSNKSDQSPELKMLLPKIQTGDLLKQKCVSSKKRSSLRNRSLSISITSKRIIRRRTDKKSEENLAPEHFLHEAQGNSSNDAIVFKEGKLILSGKFLSREGLQMAHSFQKLIHFGKESSDFDDEMEKNFNQNKLNSPENVLVGDSAAKNTLSFRNSLTKMNPGGKSGIKINYKTDYNDLYQGINDSEEFERFIYNRLPKASANNCMQTSESFFNRTVTDIARETGQHREHSQYIFKIPPNVVWNQKPSIKSTICQSRKYDGFSSSIFPSSFETQSNKMVKSNFSSKYNLGNNISVFGQNRNTTLKSDLSVLHRTRMINNQIIYPSNTNTKSQFTTHATDEQLRLSKESLRIPYSACMPSNNKISHIDSCSRDLFNTHIGKMKKPDLYVFDKNHKIGHGEKDTFNILSEQSRSTSNKPKKQFSYPCDESVSEFENYKDDPFQISMAFHRNTLSNPLRKPALSEFGDSVSEFGDYNYNSVNALIRRNRKHIPYQFGESNSEFGNDNPFQSRERQGYVASNQLRKTTIGVNNPDFEVNILTERNRRTMSNLTRKHPFGECDSDFGNHRDYPNKIHVERSKIASTNPPRIKMPRSFGENFSECGNYSELRIPTERTRDTLSNHLTRPSFYALECNDSEFGINEDDLFRSSNNRKTSHVNMCDAHIRNPSINDTKSMDRAPCSTFVEREMQSVDYYNNGTFKIPGGRNLKRKAVPREELDESEHKKSRFEESRFSTASNIVSSSTKICNFFKGNDTHTSFSIRKSSMITPISKVMETVELMNAANTVDNLSNGIKHHNTNKYNIRSNYFSDNDHDDTVISSHEYIRNKPSSNDSKQGVEAGNVQHLNDREETKSNKKYIICEDSFNAKSDYDEQRDCDDDTFFFKGSYTKPSVSEETMSNRMPPDTSKINSLCSASTSKQSALNPRNFPDSRPSRMESVNSSAAGRYRSLDWRGGSGAQSHTWRSNGDHPLHPISDDSLARKSSNTLLKCTSSRQMSFSDTFKKPAPVETVSDTEDQQTTVVNRAVNCSPWRFANW